MYYKNEIYIKDYKNTNVLTVGRYCIRGDNKGKKAQVQKRFHFSKIIRIFRSTMSQQENLLQLHLQTKCQEITSNELL